MTSAHYVFVSTEDDVHLVKGGIGTCLGILTRELARRGHRVAWVTQSPTPHDFEETTEGVHRCFVSGDRSKLADRIEQRAETIVAAWLESEPSRPVVVEAPDWEGLLAGAFARWRSEPCVLRVTRTHTPLAVCMQTNRLDPSPDNLRQIERERRQMQHSDLLSSPTRFTLDATIREVLDGTPPCPTVVIGNGVNAERFHPRPQTSSRAALERLASLTGVTMPPDAFRIFVVGSVEFRKGVSIVHEALPQLLALDRDIELCWLGHYRSEAGANLNANSKLTERQFYEPIPSQLRHRVHLGGYVDYRELPHLYPAADLFVFCYLADNFPGALAEVGLSERPMITLLRGGVPEMIVRGGRPLAIALEGSDDTAVAAALVEAVRAHRAAPSTGARLAKRLGAHLREHFDVRRIVDRMQACYDPMIAAKLRPATLTTR